MKTPRGFSLIELMVAIAIGLLLLFGLDMVFVTMNQTYTLRQKLSAFQDNERMAMWILASSIRNAGWFPNPVSTTPLVFTTAAASFPASGAYSAGQSLSGTTGTGNDDSLSVRFIAGTSAFQGCSAQLNQGDRYTDAFSVSGGYLTCTETDNTSGVVNAVNLIAGVSGMVVRYGVDTNGSGSVTQYQSASSVSLWSAVKTVKVTLQFANPLQGQSGQAASLSVSQTIPYMVGL